MNFILSFCIFFGAVVLFFDNGSKKFDGWRRGSWVAALVGLAVTLASVTRTEKDICELKEQLAEQRPAAAAPADPTPAGNAQAAETPED